MTIVQAGCKLARCLILSTHRKASSLFLTSQMMKVKVMIMVTEIKGKIMRRRRRKLMRIMIMMMMTMRRRKKMMMMMMMMMDIRIMMMKMMMRSRKMMIGG